MKNLYFKKLTILLVIIMILIINESLFNICLNDFNSWVNKIANDINLYFLNDIFWFHWKLNGIMLGFTVLRLFYLRNTFKSWSIKQKKSVSTQTGGNVSEEALMLSHIKSFLTKKDIKSLNIATNNEQKGIVKYISTKNILNQTISDSTTNTIIPTLSLTSIFVAAILIRLPIQDILNHLIIMNEFSPLLSNPDAVISLIQIYNNANQPIPEILRQAAHLPNPQDYLLPGEEIYNANINKTYFSLGWKISLALLGVVGVSYGIYWYNTTC